MYEYLFGSDQFTPARGLPRIPRYSCQVSRHVGSK